jgi:hypothetical protein
MLSFHTMISFQTFYGNKPMLTVFGPLIQWIHRWCDALKVSHTKHFSAHRWPPSLLGKFGKQTVHSWCRFGDKIRCIRMNRVSLWASPTINTSSMTTCKRPIPQKKPSLLPTPLLNTIDIVTGVCVCLIFKYPTKAIYTFQGHTNIVHTSFLKRFHS